MKASQVFLFSFYAIAHKHVKRYVPIYPRTPQVLSVEKRLAGNPLASGGLQNNVVSDKEDAKRKGKKTKKMIRMAGGQVELPLC